MFAELDQAIRKIILDAPSTATPALDAATIDFQTPEKGYPFSNETINVFLLEIKENRMLRDPEPIYEWDAVEYKRKTPPMRVDVTYVVTAWSKAGDPIQAEHRLLAQALGWLNQHPVIPAAYVPSQPFPVVMFTAPPDERLSTGEFWSALGIPPRAAFTLTATVALDYTPAIPYGPPVVAKEIQINRKMPPGVPEPVLDVGFEIAGTVYAAGTTTVITDAQVDLLPIALSTTTDAEGHFHFSGLAAGNYTLRVTNSGNTRNTPIVVPPVPGSGANSYDIEI